MPRALSRSVLDDSILLGQYRLCTRERQRDPTHSQPDQGSRLHRDRRRLRRYAHATGQHLRGHIRARGELRRSHDNFTRITPPGRSAHQLRYTGADQAERYIPPVLPGVDAEVGFHYDADLSPEVADGPGDQRITFHHDQAGRIESIALARGDYVHQYDPATGHLAHLTSPDAVGLHYGRDGPLLRETRWTIPGASDVAVSHDYDDAFRPWKLAIQGEPPIEHGYDADDYLIQAGPLAILRDAQTGLPDIALTHTASGHLASKTDTVTGESTAYRYDEFGNLLGVDLADGRSIQYLIDGAQAGDGEPHQGQLPVADPRAGQAQQAERNLSGPAG